MPIAPLAHVNASSKPLNVVLIVIDTLRAKKLSCYGHSRPTSPNIDRLAREGVLFENHFATGCWTLPSHASMFTGMYPFSHRADIEHPYLDTAYPTWAEIATALKCRAAAFNPNNWIRVSQADRGFGLYDECRKPPGYRAGTRFTAERFAQWLATYRGDEAPFFAFLNFGDPHLRCWPLEENRRRFLLEGATEEEAAAIDQKPTRSTAGLARLTERQWAILESLNDGCVADADERVGFVRQTLEAEGLLDDTLLIVTSDHGDIYHEHPPQMAHTMNVYDCCIHVPLVVRLPGVFEGGKRVVSLTQNTDYLPTWLGLAGVELEGALASIQGKSLIDALEGETRAFAFAEDPCPWNELERFERMPGARDLRRFHRLLRTARTHEWKYIYSSNGADELYRIAEDKDEQTNRIDERPDVARQLFEAMDSWLAEMPTRAAPGLVNTAPGKPATFASASRMARWRGAIARFGESEGALS
ncbi:MAG: Choline-sulfatase [candidate division BRC1 bacterium ADurb.BinA364]|nr:MAG: Choline-sulfatase [candidate division BRC1 bacterium ADurb.BinA364]